MKQKREKNPHRRVFDDVLIRFSQETLTWLRNFESLHMYFSQQQGTKM